MKHKPRTMAVPLSMGWLPDVPKQNISPNRGVVRVPGEGNPLARPLGWTAGMTDGPAGLLGRTSWMPAGLLRWTDGMLAGLLGRAEWTTTVTGNAAVGSRLLSLRAGLGPGSVNWGLGTGLRGWDPVCFRGNRELWELRGWDPDYFRGNGGLGELQGWDPDCFRVNGELYPAAGVENLEIGAGTGLDIQWSYWQVTFRVLPGLSAALVLRSGGRHLCSLCSAPGAGFRRYSKGIFSTPL